ncbi:MAG: glycosyltransferase, partial [Stellaceae bacterium]
MTPATIVHVITDLGAGGAERMLLRLVTRSTRFRHVVVSLTRGGALVTALRDAGIAVRELDMRRGIFSPAAVFRLARIIRRERPALVQTWLYHADLIGLLAARLAAVRPLAWNLRCSNMDLGRYRWATRLAVKTLAILSSQPSAVLVNSHAGQRWHAALGYHPRRWAFVPNGIDTAVFRPDAESRARWRNRLGASS